MRITNGIMINNNMYNINKNKVQMDKIMTQIDTTKKIQRPSEDPITAIRALRLRSTLNEIEQYKDRNVKDAESWMNTTKGAMDKINDTLEDIILYCNQGVNTYQTSEEYDAIISTLKQFRAEVYSTGNVDYGGRTVFTGYKTDSTLTFTENDETVSYAITEKKNFADIKNVERVVGVSSSHVSDPASTNVIYEGAMITDKTLHVMNLAYDSIDKAALEMEPAQNISMRSMETYEANGRSVYSDIGDDEVVFVPETGELIFGENVYNSLRSSDFSVTYQKTGFLQGELRPEHYFDCIKTEQVGGQPETTKYTAKDQSIDYVVSFNQSITVNVQGSDILQHVVGRDLDEIINRVEDMKTALDKKEKLEREMQFAVTEQDKTKLTAMQEAVELEISYAQENVKNSFADGIKNFKAHQQTVSVTTSDLGARMRRLEMIKDRLEQQYLTVEELKSQNEDTNMSEAAVEYNAMSDVYDAALSTTVKVVQKSLLDFM